MVISMAVLLVPIIIALAVWRYVSSGNEVNTVDPTSTIQQARQTGHFPVAVPTGLGDDWKVTSAANDVSGATQTLRLGYVTPDGGFAQVVESNQDAAKLLAGSVPDGARPTGAVRIGGHDWSRYTGQKSRAVLALLEPKRTILVVGQTSDAELRTLAGSLR